MTNKKSGGLKKWGCEKNSISILMEKNNFGYNKIIIKIWY